MTLMDEARFQVSLLTAHATASKAAIQTSAWSHAATLASRRSSGPIMPRSRGRAVRGGVVGAISPSRRDHVPHQTCSAAALHTEA